ncbi:hypothetical protein R3P38DRAFT_2772786 [Favolaschia claudopus]|uniref:Uncharacterized protein n=1 Tax=Favolaschia claudopus TaxID=2862362 RepID=A0AAW0C3A4_9AGAR
MFPAEEPNVEMDVDDPLWTQEPLLLPSNDQLIFEMGLNHEADELPSPEETRALLKQEYQRMLIRAYEEAYLEKEDEAASLSGEAILSGGMEGDDDVDIDDSDLGPSSEYYPYPNKPAMLLDIMDNLPRCRFSSAQMNLVIHFAQQLGVQNVPSLKSLRKMQQQLQTTCGNEPSKIESTQGNLFYMNDIRTTIANDFANPLVAPHLRFYPELLTKGPVSETFQAERWMEYTPEQLTPMFSKGHKRFWIEELACCADGTFVIPHSWMVQDGVLISEVSIAKHADDGRWYLEKEEEIIKADDLDLDYEDIVARNGGTLKWVDPSKIPAMPNPMRELVDDDEDLYVVMVSPWADDVSGNRSKQYNKHMNMYTGNGCLPGRLLQQEFHVHYVSSSPHASSAEQFAAFRDHVKETETKPVKAFNAVTGRKCRFIIRVPGLPADNPQQSEEASHMGANANFPCRKCHWGGTTVEKEQDQAYHECHLAGVARTAKEIRANLKTQLEHATRGDSKSVENLQRSTGTKDKTTQYWIDQLVSKAKAIKAEHPRRTVDEIATELSAWLEAQPGNKMNPLLDLTCLDPSQDTPVELLHTILLGVIKYIWHHLHTHQWSDADRHLLAIRLQSTDITGLTIPPIRASYMMQYKNNLIGKHFKTIMQILAFHAHDICTPEQFALIKAAADLGARLWIPEIDDMEQYLADLKVGIANLLDAFDAVEPLRILTKIKLHLLVHIPDDVRRFGPLIRFSTEIYEAYNTVFRQCSVLSNHLAPSRDISRKFASMNRVKHLLCGGYWEDQQTKRWIQSGALVRSTLQTDKTLQRHLGWASPPEKTPGQISALSLAQKAAVEWRSSAASQHYSCGPLPAPESSWRHGRSLVTYTGDEVSVNSWVTAKHKGHTIFGRIRELLVGSKHLVTLERFIVGGSAHPVFGWPVLRRPTGPEIIAGTESFVVLAGEFVQFVVSVQHDCRMGHCKPAVVGKQRQERQETSQDRCLIKHTEDDHFILNMGGLHNFVHLCRALPRTLTNLQPLHPGDESTTFHKAVAKKARESRNKKREQTAAKRRHTAQTKKREAEAAAVAAKEAEESAKQAEDAEARGEDIPEDERAEEHDKAADDSDMEGHGSDEEAGGGSDEELVVYLYLAWPVEEQIQINMSGMYGVMTERDWMSWNGDEGGGREGSLCKEESKVGLSEWTNASKKETTEGKSKAELETSRRAGGYLEDGEIDDDSGGGAMCACIHAAMRGEERAVNEELQERGQAGCLVTIGRMDISSRTERGGGGTKYIRGEERREEKRREEKQVWGAWMLSYASGVKYGAARVTATRKF